MQETSSGLERPALPGQETALSVGEPRAFRTEQLELDSVLGPEYEHLAAADPAHQAEEGRGRKNSIAGAPMKDRVKEVLDCLEQEMNRVGHRAASLLRPGISPPDLKRLIPVVLPDEIVELYGIHDGTRTEGEKLGDLWLFPLCYFMAAGEAVAEYHGLLRDVEWERDLFPVFRDGAGTYYACETGAAARSPIHCVSLQDAEADVHFESLVSMLRTVVRGYQIGAIYLGNRGVAFDPVSFAEIAKELNPGVAYWRTHSA